MLWSLHDAFCLVTYFPMHKERITHAHFIPKLVGSGCWLKKKGICCQQWLQLGEFLVDTTIEAVVIA